MCLMKFYHVIMQCVNDTRKIILCSRVGFFPLGEPTGFELHGIGLADVAPIPLRHEIIMRQFT